MCHARIQAVSDFFLFSLILSRYRQLYRYPNRIRIGLDEVPLPAIDRQSFFLAFVDCRRWSSSSPFLLICLSDSHSLSLALPLFWIGIANRNFFFFFCFPAHLLSGLGFSFTALGPLIMLYIVCFEDVEKSADLLKSLLVGTLFGWSCIWGFTQCISVFYFVQSVFVSVWFVCICS